MAMICDHQSKKLPSCVAPQMAMIYFEKSNIPNASETNKCSCNGRHFIESFDYKGLQPLDGTQFCQRKAALVSCSETATVRFRFTGNNSARQPTLFAFLTFLERCADELERVRSSSVSSRFFADYNRKYCAFFNKGNAVFEDLIQKIKALLRAAYWFSEVKSDRACFHSQLVKQRSKKSQYFSFASFTIKTWFSEQAIQSSVSGTHGYNLNQLIENEKKREIAF